MKKLLVGIICLVLYPFIMAFIFVLFLLGGVLRLLQYLWSGK